MNKLFFSLIGISSLIFCERGFAQDAKFGLRAGINVVNFEGDDDNITEGDRPGFVAGFFYDNIFSDKIGIEIGFMYARVGAIDNFDTSDISIGYLSVPIVVKYYILSSVNIHAGLQFSILSDATFKSGTDRSELFKIGKTSAVFGAEYKTNFGLVAGVRYNLGLSSIIAPQSPSTFGRDEDVEFDVKYHSLQASIGYLF